MADDTRARSVAAMLEVIDAHEWCGVWGGDNAWAGKTCRCGQRWSPFHVAEALADAGIGHASSLSDADCTDQSGAARRTRRHAPRWPAPSPGGTMGKWIDFVDAGESPSGKTRRWEVATKAGVVIGRVEWSSGWRKYVLRPAYPTEWEQDCLCDVADFLAAHTAAQRNVVPRG